MNTTTDRIRATIPEHLLYSWESQVEQYDEAKPPGTGHGITYFPGDIPEVGIVDCLLFWRDFQIVGILNYYSPGADWSPWEQLGNVNIWVRPDCQRQGIGTTLFREADRRWGINLFKQRYTPAGAAWARRYLSITDKEHQ